MKNIKNVKDLTGQRFGRLTVIGIHQTETRKTYWDCMCDCGNMKVVRSDSLQRGKIKSCGCLKKEQDVKNLLCGPKLYSIWIKMKNRCYNEPAHDYGRYGGRGIKMCDEWLASFQSFHSWALANGYSDKLTIERINNDGDYCPCNCRWATMKEQCNNRSTNINIKIGNTTKTLMEWCEIFGVSYMKAYKRYKKNGFSGIEDLFN